MAIPEGTLPAEPPLRADQGPLEANPHIFVLLESDRPRALSARHSLAGIDRVIVGRGAQRGASREARTLHIALPDRWLSTSHSTLLRSRKGQWILRDTDSRNGTRINGEQIRERTVIDGDILEVGHTLLLFRDAVETYAHESNDDVDAAHQLPPARGILSIVPSYERQLAQLQKIAPSNVDVLLLGQSGTGKEVVARAIAQLSRRRGAFVAVNCGGIPNQLMESEMFGSVRGAFSGAIADRVGLVRTADGGTLFLDEIADLYRWHRRRRYFASCKSGTCDRSAARALFPLTSVSSPQPIATSPAWWPTAAFAPTYSRDLLDFK